MNRKIVLITLLSVATGLTSACGGNVKEELGLKKQAPDEFKVVSNLPLSVPPDFRLPAPRPGAKRPQQASVEQQAKSLLFNGQASDETQAVNPTDTNVQSSALLSKGESDLLQKAGTDQADPQIRALLTREEDTQRAKKENEGFFSKIFDKREKPDPVLNATAEKKRIETAKRDGDTITGKDTAISQKEDKGILGQWLGL